MKLRRLTQSRFRPMDVAPRNAHAALLHVLQREIGLRRHDRVVERVVLVEHGNAEIVQDAREGEVDLRAGLRIAVATLIIHGRDFDHRVRQFDLDQRQHVFVDHRRVEFEVIADERPAADEMQEIAHDLANALALLGLALEDMMDLDRIRLHLRVGPRDRDEFLAGENAVSPHLHRRDRDDVVLYDIEPGRLAIDDDDFVRRPLFEQEAIGLVGQREIMEPAFEAARQHVRTSRNCNGGAGSRGKASPP